MRRLLLSVALIACKGDPAAGRRYRQERSQRRHRARHPDLLELNDKLRHGDHDWLVARRTPTGYELVATGDFARGADGSWLVPRN